MKKLVCNYV